MISRSERQQRMSDTPPEREAEKRTKPVECLMCGKTVRPSAKAFALERGVMCYRCFRSKHAATYRFFYGDSKAV